MYNLLLCSSGIFCQNLFVEALLTCPPCNCHLARSDLTLTTLCYTCYPHRVSPRVYGELRNMLELPSTYRLMKLIKKEKLDKYRREQEAKAANQSQSAANSSNQSQPSHNTVHQMEEPTEIDWSKFEVMAPASDGPEGIVLPNIDSDALAKKLSGLFS